MSNPPPPLPGKRRWLLRVINLMWTVPWMEAHTWKQFKLYSILNCFALIRDALRQHLKTLSIRALEVRERQGYEAIPPVSTDVSDWEAEAVWPEM